MREKLRVVEAEEKVESLGIEVGSLVITDGNSRVYGVFRGNARKANMWFVREDLRNAYAVEVHVDLDPLGGKVPDNRYR